MPLSPFLAPERDSARQIGRGKDSGANLYACLPGFVTAAASQSSTGMNGPIWYTRFYCEAPILVPSTLIEVSASQAATTMRGAIYVANMDWQPTKLLLDTGDLSSATTGVKTYTPTNPLYLPRGRYLTGFQSSGTTSGVRSVVGTLATGGPLVQQGMGAATFGTPTVTFTYGAFTDPGTAWTGVVSNGNGSLAFMFLNQPTTL